MFTGYEMVRYHTSGDVYEERLAANVFAVAEAVLEILEWLDTRSLEYPTRDGLAPRPGWSTLVENVLEARQ